MAKKQQMEPAEELQGKFEGDVVPAVAPVQSNFPPEEEPYDGPTGIPEFPNSEILNIPKIDVILYNTKTKKTLPFPLQNILSLCHVEDGRMVFKRHEYKIIKGRKEIEELKDVKGNKLLYVVE